MSDRHEEELVAADDTVIGKAFRWSALAFLGIVAVIALVVILQTREKAAPAPVEAPVVPPRVQTRTVEPPAVRFTDITAQSGIDFVHHSGARGQKLLPETMGAGCAFFDYDADEDPDLLLVDGMPWPEDRQDGQALPTLRLYRNDGGGTFSDATAGSGLEVSLYGMGVAVGDYDGDGRVDLFVTAVGPNRLFRNLGGRFEEVTAEAGVAGAADEWSTSAAFFDGDGDGDLDLVVCNYVRWSRELDLAVNYRLTGVGRAYGPPTDFAGTQPWLYRNEGDGTLTEIGEAAGLWVQNPATGAPVAKSLAVLPIDVDRDGRIDLVVANDTTRNFVYRNLGGLAFEEVGVRLGIAYDGEGAATGAMGIDASHYRADGALGIGIGNFANEMTSFYVAEQGSTFFSDEAITEGVGPASRLMLSFGILFLDYDLDGRPDLFQTNGHIEQDINQVQPSQHYEQPSQLFWNCGPEHASCFLPVDGATTGDLSHPVVGRAAAYADIDGDGDQDLLLTQAGRPAILLRNDQDLGHGWLRLRLVGRRCNRAAYGAWVEVDAGGRTQRQQVMPTRSYLSQVETVLTFGLGEHEQADAVRVRWPGQERPQEVGSVPAGSYRVIEQR